MPFDGDRVLFAVVSAARIEATQTNALSIEFSSPTGAASWSVQHAYLLNTDGTWNTAWGDFKAAFRVELGADPVGHLCLSADDSNGMADVPIPLKTRLLTAFTEGRTFAVVINTGTADTAQQRTVNCHLRAFKTLSYVAAFNAAGDGLLATPAVPNVPLGDAVADTNHELRSVTFASTGLHTCTVDANGVITMNGAFLADNTTHDFTLTVTNNLTSALPPFTSVFDGVAQVSGFPSLLVSAIATTGTAGASQPTLAIPNFNTGALTIDPAAVPSAIQGATSYSAPIALNPDPGMANATLEWELSGNAYLEVNDADPADIAATIDLQADQEVPDGWSDASITVRKKQLDYTLAEGNASKTIGITADTLSPTIDYLVAVGGAELPAHVAADNATPQDFVIEITDTQTDLDLANLAITLRVHPRSSPDTFEEYICGFSGSVWQSSPPLPSGFMVNAPTLPDAPPDPEHARITGTLSRKADYCRVELIVSVQDEKGNVGAPDRRRFDILIPIQVELLLDYSGSMSTVADTGTGLTKWKSTEAAAGLFNIVFGALWPEIAPGSSNELATSRFHWGGGALVHTIANDFGTPPLALTTAAIPPGSNCTPIGDALQAAYVHSDAAAAGTIRDRVIVLLTDGMHNRGTLDVPAIVDAVIPSVNSPAHAAGTAYRISTVSYGPTGSTSVSDLVALADRYSGRHYSTETGADPNAPSTLSAYFASVLADLLPVELIEPVGGNFTIEDGVDRVIFVARDSVGTGLTAQDSGATQTTTGGAPSGGLRFVVVDNPVADTWQITDAAAGAETFALLDLRLRTRFGVEAPGVGRPAKIWAEVDYVGSPVSGASIHVEVSRPLESVGDVLGTYAQSGHLTRAILTGTLPTLAPATPTPGTPLFMRPASLLALSPRIAASTLGRTIAARLTPPAPDPLSAQRQLLVAATAARGRDFTYVGNGLTLKQVGPGRYEAELATTDIDGVYGFTFSAAGKTPKGSAFKRRYRMTEYLAPVPDPEQTTLTWTREPLDARRDRLVATVVPRTRTGHLVGPTYAGSLQFLPQDPRGAPLAAKTVDNLDGSYSLELLVKRQQVQPGLAVTFGKLDPKAKRPYLREPIPIRPGRSRLLRRVKVTLTGLEFRLEPASWVKGRRRVALEAVVMPNSNPNRAVRRAVPPRGLAVPASPRRIRLDEVLFDGEIEQGASLDISLGGAQYGALGFWSKRDPLAGYRRVLRGPIELWSGEYKPGDERNDPERLEDWAVWYRVEVE